MVLKALARGMKIPVQYDILLIKPQTMHTTHDAGRCDRKLDTLGEIAVDVA
jgi:hypothetical protein